MSDSMERNKNESIAAKELEEEEEEMKRELLDMGMYESGYTYKEMKDILGFISESKNMANMNNDNKTTQKDSLHSSNECATEPALKTNLMQELDTQEHSNTNRPIHLYRANRTSPIPDRITTHDSSSPESMSIFESRTLSHRRKSSDSDDMFDRAHDNQSIRDSGPNSTNRYSLRSRTSLHETQNMHATELKADGQSEQNMKSDRWRINPLDCFVSESDVPLHQPDRPLAEDREPLKLCKDAHSSEMLEKVLIALNLQLKETSDLWHSWHRTTDSKFQWGSPIQVGTANGSLDRKQTSSGKTESTRTESVAKSFEERACKRKYLSPTTAHLLLSSDEDDDEADFVSLKKKKVQSRTEHTSNFRHRKKSTTDDSSATVNKTQVRDQILKCDKTQDSSTHSKAFRKLFTNEEDWEESPNVERSSTKSSNKIDRKKSVSVEVHKESDALCDSEQDRSVGKSVEQKQNKALQDDEIFMELDKNSADEAADSSKKKEIKPLPLKRLSVRLERGCALLKKCQMEEQRKKEAEVEETRRREEEERKKMQEAMKQRLEEMQKRYKQREDAQKQGKEKSAKWNNVLQLKNKESKERFRAVQEQELRLLEVAEDEHACRLSTVTTDEQEEDSEDLIECVPCPICNKPFPNSKIEMHAASCEQYDADDDVNMVQTKTRYTRKSKPDANILECNICSKFKTYNGIDYEDHVNSCLRRKEKDEESESYGSTSVAIHDIPNSPIRCFRPISEQTNTEIDYKTQFASTSRGQTNRGRKRKR